MSETSATKRGTEPEFQFSDWMEWEKRSGFDKRHLPGVYAMAHFTEAPYGAADPLCAEVIYIGETCDNTLLGRWRQFNRAAFESKFGHSGGKTYSGMREVLSGRLFVAALPVSSGNEHLDPLFIRYAERKLIWEFANRWGHAPRCNRK
jgi:hypothetical protein